MTLKEGQVRTVLGEKRSSSVLRPTQEASFSSAIWPVASSQRSGYSRPKTRNSQWRWKPVGKIIPHCVSMDLFLAKDRVFSGLSVFN